MKKLSDRWMFYCGLLVGMNVPVDDLKHIQNLIEAEEQGLLHKAEIKDGTPIWYIASLDDEEPFLVKSSYIYNVTEYEVGDLEKDFWLSEEEAEAKLKEMDGES